jgi:putative hydrolase of the HAD superfamily
MSAARAPIALLVDWGGVLTSSPFDAIAAFASAEGLSRDSVTRSLKRGGPLHQPFVDLETGLITDESFEEQCARGLGLAPGRADGLRERMFAAMQPNDALRAEIASIRRRGVLVGLLSNSVGTGGYDDEVMAELFDLAVISREVRTRKPNPDIYEIALGRVGVPADQIVFVDDLPANLAPARDLGMITVLHRDNASTTAALAEVFARLPDTA